MILKLRLLPLVAIAALGACSRPQATPAEPAPAAPQVSAEQSLVDPPLPGSPGGLPDDRTPISEAPFTEAPFTEDSAQGAANVVQTYYALLGGRAFDKAWVLWRDGGKASGQPTAPAFAASFDRYAQYNAQVGGPGAIEGAAGSLYVTVPVVIYGRLKTGQEVHEKGQATLRRINDVPGSTGEQRRWHIAKIETEAMR